jgi:Condensation domain
MGPLEGAASDREVLADRMDTTMPASWAQAARLRNEERYGGYDAQYNLFLVDAGLTIDDLSDAIRAVLERESTYRIFRGGRDADGQMMITLFPGPPEVAIERVVCQTVGDADFWCRDVSVQRFNVADDAPLWRVAIFEVQSIGALAVGLVCDHLICDGRSLWLFKQAVKGGKQPHSPRLAKPYLSWARNQAVEFGSSPGARGQRGEDFWTSYLVGAQADAASALDIALPSIDSFRGTAVTVTSPLRSNLTDVRRAAAAQSVLPLAVVLAKASEVAMRHAVGDEVSLRFITHGRPPGYTRTHGFYADSLPFLANRILLEGSHQAVQKVAQFLEEASPHQDTPWDFIRTRCGGRKVPIDEEPGDRQLVVNLVPYDLSEWQMGPVEHVIWHDGHIESLHVVLGLDVEGPGQVSATFNPEHFDLAGVQSFVAALCDDVDRAV